ncbi:MAG: hypothetical protein L0H73_11905 [Nitrococcus sp.]|nr:hypothetical protein [Nitrococcus sp.]
MTIDTKFFFGKIRYPARFQFLLIVALFTAPVVAALVAFWGGWWPTSTSNNGELLEPPIAMAPSEWTTREGESFGRADLVGYWNLLVVVDGPCDAWCMETLDVLRRLRIALNRNAGRVHLLLLQPRGAPPPDLPEVSNPVVFELLAPASSIASLLAQSAGGKGAGRGVFIVDYRAFNMMTYLLPLDGSGMLDDVQHLLRVSNPLSEQAELEELLQSQDSQR